MIVIPGNHDSRNVGYVHFEELFGERRSELHMNGVSILAVDSTEPDLDNGTDRPRALRVDRGALRRARRVSADLRPAPPPAARPGHGPRAQHRPRRGRHARVPPARRCAPGALRPQARSIRVAAREPVRRERRHRLDHAPPRQDEALLQRDRGDARARHGVPEVPLPRAGRDPRLRPADLRVREGPRRCWARPPRADARTEWSGKNARRAGDRPHRRGAPPVHGPRRARRARPGRRGLLRRRGEARRGLRWRTTTACLWSRDAEEGLRRLAPRADAVVDLADEPVVPASRKLRLAALALESRACVRGAGRAARPAALRARRVRRAEARRDRHRQAHGEDGGGGPLGHAAARPGSRPGDRLHGPRWAARADA